MTKEKSPARQGPRYIFYFLMLAILGWFIFMQFFGADERTVSGNSPSLLYPGTFTWEKPDGTTEEITVPGSYDVPAGETMVITSTLPADFDASSIAIRSSLQDVNIYINGTLREQYSTSKTRLIGKNSASRFIFCSTSHEDAGKELRIELTTYTSNYSGVVNQIFCGDKADIWQLIFNHYGLATYIAFFTLFAGLTTILFSLTLGFVYHTSFDMEYLGWCMIMGATWMLGESKIRQLLIPNSSALASLCFVMILLGPIPLLLYADNVQHGLHRRLYHIVIGISLLNFIVCSILAIANIADFIETLPLGQIILIGTFLMVFIHLCLYIRNRKKASDHLLLLAHLLILLCVAAECVSVYFVTSLSGLFIGIGMLLLLFVNIVRTLRSIQHIENERQQQELERKQKQTEILSLQMMQTLSTTIEAKDEYTRGHSYRVAEYAALIAEFMQEHNGCLIFLDMDNLKKINDVYGHMAGDRALRNLGTLLSRYTANGIACRLGGDEFLLFLPDISAENVSKLTTRLFHHFHSIAEADPEIKDAALSAGLYMCTTSDTFADCYSKADKALYNVKQNGKNHFSFYHQISHSSSDSPGTARDLQQVADALRKSGSYAGALELNYRDFSRQYEYMQQLIIRSGSRCYLVMLTLEATSDTPAHIEEIEQTLSHMEQAIQNTIRRVDICTRYSSMQYLIILFQPVESQIPNIMERIFMQYYRKAKSTNFLPTYKYLSMAENNMDTNQK